MRDQRGCRGGLDLRLVSVPDAGRHVHMDAPLAVGDAIRTFLDGAV